MVLGGPTVVLDLGGLRIVSDPTFDDPGLAPWTSHVVPRPGGGELTVSRPTKLVHRSGRLAAAAGAPTTGASPASSRRSATPNLRSSDETWLSTVRTEMCSQRVISTPSVVNPYWPPMRGQPCHRRLLANSHALGGGHPGRREIVVDPIRTISRVAAVLVVLAAIILLAAPGFT